MSRWNLLRPALVLVMLAVTLLPTAASAAQDAAATPAYDFSTIPFTNSSAVTASDATPEASPIATPEGDVDMHGGLLGEPDAPVTLTIYADYQCPHCRSFHAELEPLLVEDLVLTGDARLEFVDFPVIGISSVQELSDDTKESVQAAEATMCAAEQDAFMEYREALYAGPLEPNSGALSDENLARIADELGLDSDALAACLESGTYEHAVIAGMRGGLELGVQGTPTMVLNDEVVQVESYDELIDLVRNAGE